jgi:coenzyme F420-0:L-glutamate ligase / coenzyme F420-1:gamma-L-glutamate ligase
VYEQTQLAQSYLAKLITERRSIRRYSPQAVPPALINHLLELALWAPSAHNRQPARFAVITELRDKVALAETMGQRLRADLAADGRPAEAIEADAGRSYARITGAPALVLLCLSLSDMDSYPDAKRAEFERVMAIQSVAMAGQNLLLAAHAEGLGACWMCAPLFCPEVVSAALSLPTDWQPQALITLGYPAQTRESTRQPLAEKVLWK